MSLWSAILERLEPIRLDLSKRFRPVSPTSHVDFSIALIALSAKLAKADGHVSRSEVAMFRRIMEIPPREEHRVGRIYNLCRQETNGFESYANRISRLIRGHPDEVVIQENLLDGLFHIAMADGEYHPNEDRFLRITARLIGVGEDEFSRILARHVPERWDPFTVLGVSREASVREIREARNGLVKTHHPDLMVAKGLPPEMRSIAENRIRSVNRAYEELRVLMENTEYPAGPS